MIDGVKLIDCRDCKDYRDCPYWQKDLVTRGRDWYHYGEIRWCPYQVIWMLRPENREALSNGRWPKEPVESADSQKTISTEASYAMAIIVYAELTIRLDKTGEQGQILVKEIETGRDFNTLGLEAREALMYIKGFNCKRLNFGAWKKQKKYRKYRQMTTKNRQNDYQKVVKVRNLTGF